MKTNFTILSFQPVKQFEFILIWICCSLLYNSTNAQSTFEYQFDQNESQWTSDQSEAWSIKSDPRNSKDALQINTVFQQEFQHLYSIETGKTILLVRVAKVVDQSYIVASDYNGMLMGIDYNGQIKWKNELSGFVNHDVWCEDITGDGHEEILVANADGTLYCVDSSGELLWTYKHSEVPLFSVTVVHNNREPYVVVGGFELSTLYLDKNGELVKEIKNTSYSVEKAWGSGDIPQGRKHVNNFIRKFYDANGNEKLAIQGAHNGNSADGTLYLFNPFEEQPYQIIDPKLRKPVGGLNIVNVEGSIKVMMGTSTAINDSQLMVYDIDNETYSEIFFPDFGREIDRFGYRIVTPDLITYNNKSTYLSMFGSRLFLFSKDYWSNGEYKILANKYAYNDMWQDKQKNTLLLASTQSGGTCIHVIDLSDDKWVEDFEQFTPPGNMEKILSASQKIKTQVEAFQKPEYERTPLEVFFLSESKDEITQPYFEKMNANNYGTQFFANVHMPRIENWDRSEMENDFYKNKRDGRKNYSLTQQEVLDILVPNYQEGIGLNSWGGHGNDPYYYSVETKKKIIDAANGKKINFIYPELESTSDEFSFVLNDLLFPLADYGKDKNLTISLRNKHIFWSGVIHKDIWKKVLNGEYKSVFVPSMEETTDKTMELSVASRLGLWASGVFDNWGTRSARDNPSYLRLRQRSHQMLPNHFLRQMVYNISSGARYINNFAVDQEYISILWDMVEKGVIYVPKREEIVSFSPVHVSIVNPTDYYIQSGNKVKWLTWFDEGRGDESNMLFDRLNGSWPGAPTNEWDFSNFAAGVKDRRLNFLPNYKNGTVLITPPQNDHFVPEKLPRGSLVDHLHPMYKNIMTEFISNGEVIISADGATTYSAPDYYTNIKDLIEEKSRLIPLTVEGEVAWVAAQSAPKHIRVTLIDGGYLNPSDKTAILKFGSVTPKKVTDILSGKTIPLTEEGILVDIPSGTFKFLDIELQNEL
ncbi:PQQ-binding-like beta-propeller repeat protein [Flammeovirga pacifica]|nr:hypothetical protein [Flammeovirga pacifica]